MVETPSHTWPCPSCGRRVPLRADTCHCGMTRARAGELAGAAAAAPVRPASPRRRDVRVEVVAAMTAEVKALVVAFVLVMAAGLGWLVLGPSRTPSTAPVLGWVDKGPPPVPKPTPRPRPPFELPWWK